MYILFPRLLKKRNMFDKVWNESLLFKIKQYLPTYTHKLLKTKRRRKQKLSAVHHSWSSPWEDTRTILLYMSDIPTNSRTYISTFADDTAILSGHESHQEASNLLQIYLWYRYDLQSEVKYLDMQLDSCLTWKFRVDAKVTQIRLKL